MNGNELIKTFTKLESSNVSQLKYHKKEKELHVTFHSGATYAYYQVPEDVYQAAAKSHSIGKFIRAEIVPKYEYLLLGNEDKTV